LIGYKAHGPYFDKSGGALAIRYECSGCDWKLVTPFSEIVESKIRQALDDHYHKHVEAAMAVPMTSPERRGYRAMIAFGLSDNQILEFTDQLKDMNLEIREIDSAAARSAPGKVRGYKIGTSVYDPSDVVIIRDAGDREFGDEQTGWTPHNADYQYKARQIVVNAYNAQAELNGDPHLLLGDTYVVWFCKTLQNWKCLISTNMPDQTYYEVTYDGDKKQAYLDVYVKKVNLTVQD
jgi:uncharacterized protein DUF6275